MSTQTSSNWHERARAVSPRADAFIGGRALPAQSGKTFSKISPVDGRALAQVADCGPADIEAAVASARAALVRGVWSQRRPTQRKKVLRRFAELILQNKEELALLETLDLSLIHI